MRHDKAATLVKVARAMAASAEGLTLDEIGREAECGRRTAERIRDAVCELFQVDIESDPPHKRYKIPGGLDGFAQSPTTDEMLELGKAVQSLKDKGHRESAGTLDSLEKKVRSAMRQKVRTRVTTDVEALARAELIAIDAGPRPYEDRALISHIRDAVMSMKQVRFRYRGGTRSGQVRDVVPCGLMFGRANYLVAAEVGSTQPRNYRLDRISELEVLEVTANPPDGFSLRDYAERSFGIFQDEVARIGLRVRPDASEEAVNWRFHPSQLVTREEGGSVRIEFEAAGALELCWHLFSWRDQIEILEPASLRQKMIEELETCLRHHRGEV